MRIVSTMAALAFALVGGCASTGSYVDARVSPDNIQPTVAAIVRIAARESPSRGAVCLDPTPEEQNSNAITPALVDALRAEGFTIAESGAPALRYQITPLGTGTLLRVGFLTVTSSAFFSAPGVSGPLVVRKDPAA